MLSNGSSYVIVIICTSYLTFSGLYEIGISLFQRVCCFIPCIRWTGLLDLRSGGETLFTPFQGEGPFFNHWSGGGHFLPKTIRCRP